VSVGRGFFVDLDPPWKDHHSVLEKLFFLRTAFQCFSYGCCIFWSVRHTILQPLGLRKHLARDTPVKTSIEGVYQYPCRREIPFQNMGSCVGMRRCVRVTLHTRRLFVSLSTAMICRCFSAQATHDVGHSGDLKRTTCRARTLSAPYLTDCA